MNNKLTNQLAKLTINEKGDINKNVATYAASNLSRKDLANYIRSLKRYISNNFVTVHHNINIPDGLKRQIEMKFKGIPVLYKTDEKIRDGIRVVHNDTIIDLSVGGYITTALERLRG